MPKVCAFCGKSSGLICGKCKSTNYCSQACQKQHWKLHKKTCGKSVFVNRPMVVGDKCTRCLETIQADANGNPILMGCRVAHPEHEQHDRGSTHGPDGMELNYHCQACRSSYRRTSSASNTKKSKTTISSGPKWCFQGNHTLAPVERLGDCRIRSDLVVIHAGPEMQHEIDALDRNGKVKVLRICKDDFDDDDSTKQYEPRLHVKLPNLRELQVVKVSMKQIYLTPDLTPKVETLWMQNPTKDEEPDFVIQCPKLKEFSCFHWDGHSDWINTMLKHAVKLEVFDSYKLLVSDLAFASNHLKTIRLHHAECLDSLEIYAPNLARLDLQAAYELEELVLEDSHPVLSQKLPSNFCNREELQINTDGAYLSPAAKYAIFTHPRFYGMLNDMPDRRVPADPTEALLRRMRGGFGGNFFN